MTEALFVNICYYYTAYTFNNYYLYQVLATIKQLKSYINIIFVNIVTATVKTVTISNGQCITVIMFKVVLVTTYLTVQNALYRYY